MDPSHPFYALEQAFERSRDMDDVPLSDRLRVIADAVRELSPTFADAVDAFVGRLQRTGAGQEAPGPGDVLPSFMLPDQDGRLVSLEQILAKGPAVVAFHRGHWCPYCRLNAVALREIQDEIGPDRLIAITPENRKYTAALKAESGRSQRPSCWAATARSSRAISIQIIASAWTSRNCWPPLRRRSEPHAADVALQSAARSRLSSADVSGERRRPETA